jgi:hypothetical protein
MIPPWDSSCSVREIAVERLIFDRSDQQISNQPWSYTPKQLSSTPLRHMGAVVARTRPRSLAHGQHICIYALALLMHLKRCIFRPTGPFGITLRAGCAMDGAVCLIPHCHWPSRTIYGTSWRVASCWAWVLRDVFPYSVVRFPVTPVILFPLRVRYPHGRSISHVQSIMAICGQNNSNQAKPCTAIWVAWLCASAFLPPSSIFSTGFIAQCPRVIARVRKTCVLLPKGCGSPSPSSPPPFLSPFSRQGGCSRYFFRRLALGVLSSRVRQIVVFQ